LEAGPPPRGGPGITQQHLQPGPGFSHELPFACPHRLHALTPPSCFTAGHLRLQVVRCGCPRWHARGPSPRRWVRQGQELPWPCRAAACVLGGKTRKTGSVAAGNEGSYQKSVPGPWVAGRGKRRMTNLINRLRSVHTGLKPTFPERPAWEAVDRPAAGLRVARLASTSCLG